MIDPASLVSALWQKSECVGVYGIHFPNDSVRQIRFVRNGDRVSATPGDLVDPRAVLQVNPRRVATLGSDEPVPGPGGTVIYAGESFHDGAEGFVAVCEKSGDLRWLAFLDESNPFEVASVRVLDDETFEILTTYDARWRFRVDDPVRVDVFPGPYGWPLSPFWKDLPPL
jgi:hypothetical protein